MRKMNLPSFRQEGNLVSEFPVPVIVDPDELLARAGHDGPVWSFNSEQMNINLLRLSAGAGIDAHVNHEVDVFGVVVAGKGVLVLEDEEQHLHAGQAFLIPRGMRRAIRSAGGDFAYLSCHRRRKALMPSF